jgi:four helix bundle protein
MNHQKLECYQRMLRTVKEMQTVMPNLAGGTADLEDQLKRALNSAILNTVEGNGRRTPKDRRCFFNRATASLCEASACLELLGIYQPTFSDIFDRQRKELGIVYGMIRHLP